MDYFLPCFMRLLSFFDFSNIVIFQIELEALADRFLVQCFFVVCVYPNRPSNLPDFAVHYPLPEVNFVFAKTDFSAYVCSPFDCITFEEFHLLVV